MKVSAITGRGSRKDFIDLFELLKHFELKEILSFYHSKFTDGTSFLVLKSLVYFEDAEQELMPEMLITTDWQEIKEKIKSEVIKLVP